MKKQKTNSITRKIIITIALIAILALSITGYSIYEKNALKRICPKYWGGDLMPGGHGSVNFVDSNNKIHDTKTIDLDWVKASCPIKEPDVTF